MADLKKFGGNTTAVSKTLATLVDENGEALVDENNESVVGYQ